MVSRLLALGWRLPVMGLAVLAVGLASFASGAVARNAIAQPDSETIYACKGERSGSVRLVNAGETCLRGEVLVTWNVLGPAGPQGASGATGAPGPQGETGPQGPAGENAVPVVNGILNANGTIYRGNVFTVSHDPGVLYNITFAPGTWNPGTQFSATVHPFGVDVFVTAIGLSGVEPDGSAILTVGLNTEAAFSFTAVGLLPPV